MKNVPKNLRFEVSPEELREHLERTKRIEEKLIRFGNLCGHFPDNTKMVESNAGVDKVMSREEADSAMRSAIGICAIIDKNTSLLRENNKLKEELESFIIRCEYLQKEKEQLQAAIDATTLTEGESSLINALRRANGITDVFDYRATVLVSANDNASGVYAHAQHIAFFTDALGSDDELIIDALKQIKEEKEASNETK